MYLQEAYLLVLLCRVMLLVLADVSDDVSSADDEF